MSPLLPVPSLRRAYCALAAAAERPAADDQSWARLQHVALMCHEESVALPVVPAALQTWRVRFSRRWRCSCEPWQLRRQRTAGSAACRERSAPPPPRWSSVPWRVAAHPPKKWTSESLVSRGALVARVRARAPRHARPSARAQHKQKSCAATDPRHDGCGCVAQRARNIQHPSVQRCTELGCAAASRGWYSFARWTRSISPRDSGDMAQACCAPTID